MTKTSIRPFEHTAPLAYALCPKPWWNIQCSIQQKLGSNSDSLWQTRRVDYLAKMTKLVVIKLIWCFWHPPTATFPGGSPTAILLMDHRVCNDNFSTIRSQPFKDYLLFMSRPFTANLMLLLVQAQLVVQMDSMG